MAVFNMPDLEDLRQKIRDPFTERMIHSYGAQLQEGDQLTRGNSGSRFNSIITVNPDALKIAEELDREMQDGSARGPLHGVPVVLKII